MKKVISNSFNVTPVYDGQDGPQGPPGQGITSADIVFCLASSQTTAPADSSFTATSFADLNIKSSDANKYVWQCNKTFYTSGNPTYSGKVCLGKVSDFASVVEQFALGTETAATGTWQDNTPPSPSKGSYLWTRTKLTYTGGGETYSPSSAGYCLGYYGTDGKGISSADIMFCLADSQSTAPADSSFTATSFADLNIKSTDASKYVWQCNKTTYTSGSPTYSGKVCLGKVSDFASITEQYALGTASAATGTWQDNTAPSPSKGSYLWTRTKLSYTGGGVTYSPSSAGMCLGYYGTDGLPGGKGDTGTGIDSIAATFNLSKNGTSTNETTAPTDLYYNTWQSSQPAPNDTYPYVWKKEVTTYKNPTSTETKYYCIAAKGTPGKTGPMFYLCGTFPNKAPYSKDDYRCPVVYYGGEYWYLQADSATAQDTPSTASSSKWGKAEKFDMVFTDVLFVKDFAKLGSGIICGDWLISCAGYIVVNGVKTYFGPDSTFDGAPAYMQFDEYFPDVDSGENNFVPIYAVDLANGTTYQQNASVKGTIEATNGRINSLYIGEGKSSGEARIYMKADETTSGSQTKTPLIYGKDSSGNVVFRLGPAVDQPGGAAGTVFSGLAVGYAWISSGGFMVRDPSANQHYASMAPGAIELQYSVSGGGTAYARIEMTGDGLKIYSQAWPSEGQVSSGCVYKDANGYLRVKS